MHMHFRYEPAMLHILNVPIPQGWQLPEALSSNLLGAGGRLRSPRRPPTASPPWPSRSVGATRWVAPPDRLCPLVAFGSPPWGATRPRPFGFSFAAFSVSEADFAVSEADFAVSALFPVPFGY